MKMRDALNKLRKPLGKVAVILWSRCSFLSDTCLSPKGSFQSQRSKKRRLDKISPLRVCHKIMVTTMSISEQESADSFGSSPGTEVPGYSQ